MDVHHFGHLSGVNSLFQRTSLAILATRHIGVMRYFMAILPHHLVQRHLVMRTVLLIGGYDPVIPVDDDEWLINEVQHFLVRWQ